MVGRADSKYPSYEELMFAKPMPELPNRGYEWELDKEGRRTGGIKVIHEGEERFMWRPSNPDTSDRLPYLDRIYPPGQGNGLPDRFFDPNFDPRHAPRRDKNPTVGGLENLIKSMANKNG
jgi:hypothetical protein